MTNEQFTKAVTTLRANFAYAKFLQDKESQEILFNSLNRFLWADVWSAIVGIIQNGNYDSTGTIRQLTMNDVIRAAEREANIRKDAEKDKAKERTVRCPKCNDNGYTLIRYPESRAADAIKPCDCQIGRDRYPWYFLSEEEIRQARAEQRKKGQNPERPHVASAAFRKWYCYGIGDGRA